MIPSPGWGMGAAPLGSECWGSSPALCVPLSLFKFPPGSQDKGISEWGMGTVPLGSEYWSSSPALCDPLSHTNSLLEVRTMGSADGEWGMGAVPLGSEHRSAAQLSVSSYPS